MADKDAAPQRRKQIGLKGELLLALLPTAMVLFVMWFLDVATNRQVLFTSLASSAFLIYLDPNHPMNGLRTLVISHTAAALIGYGVFWVLGSGYHSAGLSMVLLILVMVVLDVVHPPAIGTTLSFAFHPKDDSSLLLFEAALVIVVVLALLSTVSIRLFRHLSRERAQK